MKLPLNLIRSEAESLESQRECGTCTACCVLPRIHLGEEPEFPKGKPGYTPCEHLCSLSGGCGIYERRPGLCRTYKCLWRAGVVAGDERRRPDQLGLMFTLDEVAGRGVVEVWELWDGAARDHPGRGVLDSLADHARVHVRFYGVPAALHYKSPDILDIGRRLSEASRDCPQALAAWLKLKVGLGDLLSNDLDSVMLDLAPLRRGEPVKRHYRPA